MESKPELPGTRSACALIPGEATIAALQEAAAGCTACPLYRNATQTVFGESPERVAIMLVGEQPGDAEDLAGHPFVGPAVKLPDRCIEEAGIDRSRTYVTNVVKYFKWVPRGPRRIHSKPGAVEIEACFPWLEAEIARVAPRIIVAFGRNCSPGSVWTSGPGNSRSRPAFANESGALRACDDPSFGPPACAGRRDAMSRDPAIPREFA
jgi:DNA polymerase